MSESDNSSQCGGPFCVLASSVARASTSMMTRQCELRCVKAREIMASLGIKKFTELIGRTDLLRHLIPTTDL
eukprot:671147-Amphidinium_carterae.1